MSKRRVVITGLGVVSPLGNTVAETWSGLIEGKSGISTLEHFDTSGFSTRIGGSVKNFDVSEYISVKEARRMDIFMQYGIAASAQALSDSGLEVTDANLKRIGVAVGSGIGGLGTIEENHKLLNDKGPRKISPFFVSASKVFVSPDGLHSPSASSPPELPSVHVVAVTMADV